MNIDEVLLTSLLTVLGSGVGTTIVGWLFKRKFDSELERQKAFLHRASRVHERQVDVLTGLYRHLWDVHAYAQLLSKASTMSGEKPDEYPKEFAGALVKARDAFFNGRLLLPSELASACDAFFRRIFEWQFELGWARDPHTPDGVARYEKWKKAQTVAFDEVPQLLKDIELRSREIIHGR